MAKAEIKIHEVCDKCPNDLMVVRCGRVNDCIRAFRRGYQKAIQEKAQPLKDKSKTPIAPAPHSVI